MQKIRNMFHTRINKENKLLAKISLLDNQIFSVYCIKTVTVSIRSLLPHYIFMNYIRMKFFWIHQWIFLNFIFFILGYRLCIYFKAQMISKVVFFLDRLKYLYMFTKCLKTKTHCTKKQKIIKARQLIYINKLFKYLYIYWNSDGET